MTTAKDIELTLWRSRLLRQDFATGPFEDACKAAARIVAKIARARMAETNGLPKEYDAARREWHMGLTEEDGARLAQEIKAGRAKLQDALRPFLTPGCVWKFYDDPRAVSVARVRDKDNRRDAFL